MENLRKNNTKFILIATLACALVVAFALCVSFNTSPAFAKVKRPAKAKIASVKVINAHKIKVSVKKVKKAKGYQVKIATNKQFTKNLKTKTSKAKTKTFSIAKTSSTQRYIKARAYKKSGGKKVYGKWSKVKTVAAIKLPTNNNADEEQANDDNREMTEQELFELQKPTCISNLKSLYTDVQIIDYYYPGFNDWDIVAYAKEKYDIAANSFNTYKEFTFAFQWLNETYINNIKGYSNFTKTDPYEIANTDEYKQFVAKYLENA